MDVLHAPVGQPRVRLATLSLTVRAHVPEASVKLVDRFSGLVEPVDRLACAGMRTSLPLPLCSPPRPAPNGVSLTSQQTQRPSTIDSRASRTAGQGYGGQRVRFLAMHPQEAVAGGSVRHTLEGVEESRAFEVSFETQKFRSLV